MAKRPLKERILQADILAGRYLGNANEAAEKGELEKCARLYDKSQFWLDRFNLLTNQADKKAKRIDTYMPPWHYTPKEGEDEDPNL